MKIFQSYGHDSNAPLIEKIKEYLLKDAEGNLRHKDPVTVAQLSCKTIEQETKTLLK